MRSSASKPFQTRAEAAAQLHLLRLAYLKLNTEDRLNVRQVIGKPITCGFWPATVDERWYAVMLVCCDLALVLLVVAEILGRAA